MQPAPPAPGKSKSYRLTLSPPWTEEQRALLKTRGSDKAVVSFYAMRVDSQGCLEIILTLRKAQRAGWLSAHIVTGEWEPTAGPRSKEERREYIHTWGALCKTSRAKAARRGQSHLLESRGVDKLFGIVSARCVRNSNPHPTLRARALHRCATC